MNGGDFGRRVGAALKERDMTMREAARAMNYDHSCLSRVLSGKQLPSPQLATAVDHLLGAEGTLAGLAASMTEGDRNRIAHIITHPTRIDAAAVKALAGVLAAQRRLDDARRLLDEAANLADAAREQPPGTAYWLTPTFQGLNLGIARLALAEYREAADHLATGLSGLPADQQGAEWTREHREALASAEERQ